MTHSLHRCGKHQEKDYVWLLYHVKGVNDQNLKQRYQKSLEIAEAAGAVNWGDVKSGPVVTLSPEEIRTRLTDKSRLRGAFSSLTQVTKFLKDMKAADMGVCVIIAGPLKEVHALLPRKRRRAAHDQLFVGGVREDGTPGG